MSEQDKPKELYQTDTHPDGLVSPDASAKSALVSAIHNLDKNNPDHFTKGGNPRVEMLTEMCGFKVTRADVIEVWGEQSEPTAPAPAQPSTTDNNPIKCLELFEVAMQGSRNAILHQFYKAWLREKPQAVELAERLKVRGQY